MLCINIVLSTCSKNLLNNIVIYWWKISINSSKFLFKSLQSFSWRIWKQRRRWCIACLIPYPHGDMIQTDTFITPWTQVITWAYITLSEDVFLILYTLKTPNTLWFCGVFRGYKMERCLLNALYTFNLRHVSRGYKGVNMNVSRTLNLGSEYKGIGLGKFMMKLILA